jgi:hypothetical protein
MPRVPTYDRQVTSTALPTPYQSQAPSGAFGAQIGEAIQHAAGTVAGIVREERANADAEAITAAMASLSESEIQHLHDTEAGALRVRGSAARGLAQRVGSDWTKTVGELRARLTTDEQRRQFDRIALSRTANVLRTLETHEAAEVERGDEETTDAAVALAVQRGAAAYTDPVVVAAAEGEVRALLKARAMRSGGGISGEMLAERTAAAVSALHAQALAQYGDTDPAGAAAYYAAHRNKLLPTARVQAEAAIRTGVRRTEAQRRVDTIWDQAGADEGRALEAARGITDVDLRDEVEARIRERSSDEQRARKLRDLELYEQADAAYTSTGRVSGIPPSLWSRLSSEAQAHFRRDEEDRRSGRELSWDDVSGAVLQDWIAYKSLPAEQRAQENLAVRFGGKIPRAAFLTLVNEWQSDRDAVRSAAAKKPTELTEVPIGDQIERTAKDAGIVPRQGKAGDNQLRDLAAFDTAARSAIRDYERKALGGKRKATEEERSPILKRLAVQVKLRDAKPTVSALVPPDAVPYAPMDEIPTPYLPYVRKYAQSMTGRGDVSKADMENAYGALLAGRDPAAAAEIERDIARREIVDEFVRRAKRPTKDKVDRALDAYLRGDQATARAIMQEP